MKAHLKIVAIHLDTQLIDVDAKCVSCGKVVDFELSLKAWTAWQAGALIQKCFPEMSLDMREILISGLCGLCFDAMFPHEEAPL